MGKNDFFKDLPRRGAKHLLATMAWTAFCTGTVYAQEWIDVTDTYITNADFSTGTMDGWDAGTALPGVNATWLNAEFFQSYNSASQNVQAEMIMERPTTPARKLSMLTCLQERIR